MTGIGRKAFYRHHLLVGRPSELGNAGTYRLAVQVNGTGAALGHTAAELCSC